MHVCIAQSAEPRNLSIPTVALAGNNGVGRKAVTPGHSTIWAPGVNARVAPASGHSLTGARIPGHTLADVETLSAVSIRHRLKTRETGLTIDPFPGSFTNAAV
jgi:hypothetical protein